MIFSVAPYLLVEDVRRSAEWYRDYLGFGFEFIRPNHRIDADACWDAYLWMTGVDALYQEFKAKGVRITREPEIMPYGNKDFDVQDCNGYVLCFGEDWQGKPAADGRQPA